MISVLFPVLVVQVLNPSVQNRVTNRLHYRHRGDDKGKTEQNCRNNKPPRNRDDVSDPENDGSRDSANAQDETSERGHRQEDLADPGNVGNSAGKRSDVLFLMLCHCLLGLSASAACIQCVICCSFNTLLYVQHYLILSGVDPVQEV